MCATVSRAQAGSTLGNSYFILGGGASYLVADGLEVGADFEGWLFQDQVIWKLSPQLRYTVWQLGALRPYVGAFWRRTFVGAGMVYERFDKDLGNDNDVWYPEGSFSLMF